MIESYFSDSLTVYLRTGVDENAVPTYGTAQNTLGRFQYSTKVFTNSEGEKALSDAVCYVAGTVSCGLKSKVVFSNDSYSVEQLKEHRDHGGAVFKRCVCQRIAS